MSVLLTTTFTQADGAPPATFVNLFNGATVVGNALRGTTAGDFNLITSTDVNPDTTNLHGPINGKITVVVKSLTGTGSFLGLSMRDPFDGVNGVYANWYSTGVLEIGQDIGGVHTALDTDTITPVAGTEFAIEYVGTTINVYLDGVLSLTGTTTWNAFGLFLLNFNPGVAASDIEIDSLTVETYTPYPILVGALAAGTGAVTPVWPTGYKADDVSLVDAESAGGEAASLTTASGFAIVDDSPSGAGVTTAGSRVTTWWCRATGTSQANPVIGDPGDHCSARHVIYRGCITSGNPWDVTAASNKLVPSTSASAPGDTTTVPNCLISVRISRSDDLATAAFSAWANADLYGGVELVDDGSASNNGGGIGQYIGVKTAAGAFTTTTATVTSSINGSLTIALKPAVAGQTVALGLCTETDSVFGFTWHKGKSVGIVAETNAALAASKKKTRTVGQTTETDSAFAVIHTRAATLGLAAESDSSLAVTHAKAKASGIAEEADSAFAVTRAGQATAIGIAAESDSALGVTHAKAKVIGLAEESDTAMPMSRVRQLAIGIASEVGSALAFAWRKLKAIGLALEIDSALAASTSGGGAEPGDPIPRAFIPWVFARHLDRLKYADQVALEAAAHAEAAGSRVWAKYGFYYFGKRLKIRVREVPSSLL